jgi:hypothetical protein|nr:MAG TPA: hypothetical protein [Caudoviricetes sp.]
MEQAEEKIDMEKRNIDEYILEEGVSTEKTVQPSKNVIERIESSEETALKIILGEES